MEGQPLYSYIVPIWDGRVSGGSCNLLSNLADNAYKIAYIYMCMCVCLTMSVCLSP